MLVSLDPGIRGSGIALFVAGTLRCAVYVPNPAKKGNGPEEVRAMALALRAFAMRQGGLVPRELVVEWPQIYTHGKGKGDPNDLLPLIGVDMALMALLENDGLMRTYRYLPREWKGTIDPETCTQRVRRRLEYSEALGVTLPPNTCGPCRDSHATTYCTKSTCLAHNVYDAIGIGLKHLGRFDARKVIAR